MTKLSDQFRLDVSLEDASWACREAIASMDWDLESFESHRLVLRRRGTFARNPSKIEVLVSEAGPDAATVSLNGEDPWGIGPWDRRNLRGQMNSLQNAVEVAARQSPKQA